LRATDAKRSDFESYLPVPLLEIRREFGIEVVRT
jgi:hypothetical protein